MTAFAWALVSFSLLVLAAFNPVKNAIVKALDEKMLAIKKGMDESFDMLESAKLELSQAQEEMKSFESRRQKIVLLARQHADNMYKEYEQKLRFLSGRRSVMLEQSIQRQRRQIARRFKEELLFRALAEVESELQIKGALIDNKALFNDSKGLLWVLRLRKSAA